MVLSAAEYFSDIVCGFGINRNPGEHGNAFGNGCQMGEKGRCSIGFSDVIDGTHHRLQILQDLHIDWGLDVWLPSLGGDNEKLAFRGKSPKDSSRLMIQRSAG